MEEEKDLFEGLRWGAEIVQLIDPDVPFNPLLEHGGEWCKVILR